MSSKYAGHLLIASHVDGKRTAAVVGKLPRSTIIETLVHQHFNLVDDVLSSVELAASEVISGLVRSVQFVVYLLPAGSSVLH